MIPKETPDKMEEMFSPLYCYDTLTLLKIMSLSDTFERNTPVDDVVKSTFPHNDIIGNNVEILMRDLMKSQSTISFLKLTADNTPLTQMELKWLKTAVNDPRAGLFLGEPTITEIRNRLKDIPGLYDPADIVVTDQEMHPDNFTDPEYIKIFRTIYEAIIKRKVLDITFHSTNRNKDLTERYIPLRMEYDLQFNRFRLQCIPYPKQESDNDQPEVHESSPSSHPHNINIQDVISIKSNAEHVCRDKIESIKKECSEGVKIIDITVMIYDRKNTLERFMLMFAYYPKKLVSANEGSCVTVITVPNNVLANVVINLIRFGTNIKVLKPDCVIEKIKDKLLRQKQLFNDEL